MKNNLKGSSRSNYRAKRKKTNYVLNGLIGVVILLIVVVAFSIFSGNDKTSAKKDAQTTAEKTTSAKKSAPKIKEDSKASTEKTSSNNNDSVKTNQENAETASSTKDNETNSDQLQTVDSPDGSTTTTAPAPAPATDQASSSGQHVTSYDSSSQDWQEMLQTMSSATGIDQGNMTVWFLGSDKSTPGGSVGTISAKDNKGQKYKVYLQWVDGQGYKATKVEQQ